MSAPGRSQARIPERVSAEGLPVSRVLVDANVLLDVLTDAFTCLELPWEAGFLAGEAFLRYRRAKGARTSPLPDSHIGAHAAIDGMALLTRDASRYRTHFPKLTLICP